LRPSSKPAGAVALVLLAALCLAACGSDDGSSTTPGAAAVEGPAAEGRSKPAPGFHQSGKLDIPAFGVEASDGELAAAEVALEGYLQAREAGEWAKACGFLLAPTRGQIQAFARRLDPAKGRTCAGAFQLTTTKFAKGTENLATAGVSSLRVKPGAGAGFALFHGSDGADYWMAMKVEGGSWKVLSTGPTDLTASR